MHEQKWKPFNIDDFVIPEFELDSSDTGTKNFQHDISATSKPFIVLSENAVEALKDIIEPRGQFLPIKTPSKRKKFIGYYPTNVLTDSIDIEKSEMKEYDYKNMGIKKKNLHFKEGTILDEYLFSVSEDRLYVFVTEKFRQRAEEAGLKGFDFEGRDFIVTVG
ncbi:imm11 family protein [Salmonella enterica]